MPDKLAHIPSFSTGVAARKMRRLEAPRTQSELIGRNGLLPGMFQNTFLTIIILVFSHDVNQRIGFSLRKMNQLR
jgi:hypothetical protein